MPNAPAMSPEELVVCYSVWDFTERTVITLDESNAYSYSFEDDVFITQPEGNGSLLATNMEFVCGVCEDADFSETVVVADNNGTPEFWCDYEYPIMENMILDNEIICARSNISGKKWDLEFSTWSSGSNDCFDDGNNKCSLYDNNSNFFVSLYAGACDYSTIQEAIDAAQEGDTISVWPDVYAESLVIDKQITLRAFEKAKTIIAPSSGPALTLLRGGNNASSPFSMRGFTLKGSDQTDESSYDAMINILLSEGSSVQHISFSNIVVNNASDWGLSVSQNTTLPPNTSLYLTIANSTFSNNGVAFGLPDDARVTTPANTLNVTMIVSNVSIINSTRTGLLFEKSPTILLMDRSLVSDSGSHGVYLQGAQYARFATTEFSNNGFKNSLDSAWLPYPSGLRIACTLEKNCSTLIVTGNNFSNNGWGANDSLFAGTGDETGYGLFITAEAPTTPIVLSSHFVDNAHIGAGFAGNVSAVLFRSSLSGNGHYAACMLSPESSSYANATGDARENYWGDPTGPSGALFGHGGAVSKGLNIPTWYWDSSMSTLVTPDLAYTYDWLSFDVIKWTNADESSVLDDLALVRVGNGSASISWESNNAAVSDYGVVTPVLAPTSVTLTATIQQLYRATLKKEFTFTVIPELISDASAVSVVVDQLSFATIALDNPLADAVSTDLNLSTKGASRTRISWSSNDADVMSSGAVIRTASTRNVTLTANVSRGNGSAKKTIDITILGTNDSTLLALMETKRALTDTLVRNGNPSLIRAGIYAPQKLSGHDAIISWSVVPTAINFSYALLPIEDDGSMIGSGSVIENEDGLLEGSGLLFSCDACELASSWSSRLSCESLETLRTAQTLLCAEDSLGYHYDVLVATVGDGVTCSGRAEDCLMTDNMTGLRARSGSDAARPLMRSRVEQEIVLVANITLDDVVVQRRFALEVAMAESAPPVEENTIFSDLGELVIALDGVGDEITEIVTIVTEEGPVNVSYAEFFEDDPVLEDFALSNEGITLTLPSGHVVYLDSDSALFLEGAITSGSGAQEIYLTDEILALARIIHLPDVDSDVYLYFANVTFGHASAGDIALRLPSGDRLDLGSADVFGGRPWNGLFLAPRLVDTTGYYSPDGTALDALMRVGDGVHEYTLSPPVNILFENMAGKRAAWSTGGYSLTAIDECVIPYTYPCSYDSGNDLVIKTEHFSLYGVFTPEVVDTSPAQSGGASGGGGSSGGASGGGSGDGGGAFSLPITEIPVVEDPALIGTAEPEPPQRITLFDLAVTLTEDLLFFGERLFAIFTLINVGDPGEVNAHLTYAITNSSNAVLLDESEIILVQTQRDVLKNFDVSKYPPGDYVLTVSMVYEDQLDPAVSQRSFTIGEPQLVNWSNTIFVSLIAIISAALLFVASPKRRSVASDDSDSSFGFGLAVNSGAVKADPGLSVSEPFGSHSARSYPKSLSRSESFMGRLLSNEKDSIIALDRQINCCERPYVPGEEDAICNIFDSSCAIHSPEQDSLLDKVADESVAFRLADGRTFRTLRELARALETMDGPTFTHHVNDVRNDFAAWTEKVFKAHKAAHMMRLAGTREGMLRLFNAIAIFEEEKKKNIRGGNL